MCRSSSDVESEIMVSFKRANSQNMLNMCLYICINIERERERERETVCV